MTLKGKGGIPDICPKCGRKSTWDWRDTENYNEQDYNGQNIHEVTCSMCAVVFIATSKVISWEQTEDA